MPGLNMRALSAVLAFAAAFATFSNAEQCYPAPSTWKQLLRSGMPPSAPFPLGTAINVKGQPIFTEKGGSIKVISNSPDFNTIIRTKNGQIYMVVQFEAPNPSSMYMIELSQNKRSGNGELTVKGDPIPIDASSSGGVWTMCAGSKSPWNTHLGGEEYEPDAKPFELATGLYNSTDGKTSLEVLDPESFSTIIDYLRYYDIYATPSTPMADVRAVFNPYNYGYGNEVAPLGNGKYNYQAIYITGRSSKELIYVMPDQKTVYITDDGERVAFFKLILDRPADFSAGTLYIAKFTQTSDANGGSFNIQWIPLAQSSNAEIKNMINSGIKFSDIFNYASPVNGTCPNGLTSINAGSAGQQCLSVKPGMEKAAAFLEARRYGAMKGGTTEFSKWEGFAFSPKRMAAYTAMSEIRRGMEDNKDKNKDSTKYDIGGPNQVRLPYNPCGCIYGMDTDSNYNIYNMKGIKCGVPTPGDDKNTCALDNLANPDNMELIDDQDVLLIGEDTTTGHRNDVLWAYNFNSGSLSRILSTPYGSEVTGVGYFPKIRNWSYMTAVVQHPYEESDQEFADTTKNPYYKGSEGYIGYYALPEWLMRNATLNFSPIGVAQTLAEQSDVISSTYISICYGANGNKSGRKMI